MKKLILPFLAIMLCCVSFPALSEDASTASSAVSLAGSYTDLEKAAVNLAVQILPQLNLNRYFAGGSGVGYLGVDLHLVTGSEDTFESINGKVSGFWKFAPEKDADGEPDYNRMVNILPLSLGFETDRSFSNSAILIELGWTPIGPRGKISSAGPSLRFGLDPLLNAGVFVQGGYKIAASGDSTAASGGNENASAEKAGDAILRLKAVANLGYALGNLSLSGHGAVWLDAVNVKIYYQAAAELGYEIPKILGKSSTVYARYDKGSGAPYFNTGDQFSSGLKIAF